jgi:hypothetical protein
MGIQLREVALMLPLLETIGRENLTEKKVLTLGVQDCYFTYERLGAFLRRNKRSYVEIPELERHYTTGFGWADVSQRQHIAKYIHQKSLFRLLGFAEENIFSLDASDYEGCDLILDLNKPFDDTHRNYGHYI